MGISFSENVQRKYRDAYGGSQENKDLIRANVAEQPKMSLGDTDNQLGLVEHNMAYFTKEITSKSLESLILNTRKPLNSPNDEKFNTRIV